MPPGRSRTPAADAVSSPPADDAQPADDSPPAGDACDPPGRRARKPAGKRGPPDVTALLATAVTGIDGAERPGQVRMAEAVHHGIETGEHLAVQAGTGTGKSLAYLVPAVRHAITQQATVVVSTATIALQRQLIDRDLPRLAASLEPSLSRAPVFAILKGRRNYLCLHRLATGAQDDPQDALFDPAAASAVGKQVQRLHEWAARTETGDRDELVPGVSEQAWRQVAVTARECIGAPRCPFGTQCFAERARDEAAQADIVVTNHALLAIDALEDFDIFPEHDVVIIDEAHDLVDRVTSVASDELSATAAEIAARRCGKMAGEKLIARLREAGEDAARVLTVLPAGRIDVLSEDLALSLAGLRDAAVSCAADLRASGKSSEEEPERIAARRSAFVAVDELRSAAERILGAFGPDLANRPDVVWMDRPQAEESGRPPTLRITPLQVGSLLAERLFGTRTVTLTSATLSLGGSFEPLARQWGLPRSGPAAAARAVPEATAAAAGAAGSGGAASAGMGPPPGPTRMSRIRSRGPGWTSAHRSTTDAAGSCTWPSICRRPAGTGWRSPTWMSCAS